MARPLLFLPWALCLTAFESFAAQPAQPGIQPVPGLPPAPTEQELRARARIWMQKLRRSPTAQQTEFVRRNLIALGKPAVPLIVEAAQTEFGDKPAPFHLWNVCLVLGRMADDRAVQYLLKRFEPVPERELKAQPDWAFVRAFAALSLGKVPDPGLAAVVPLRKVMSDEKEHSFVRRAAALALGSLADDGSIPELGRMLLNPDEASIMRGTWAIALGLIRNEKAAEAVAKLDAYLALDPRKRDPFADRMAVQALGMQKPEKAPASLKQLLDGDDDGLKSSVVLVLGWIGDRDSSGTIEKLMNDEQASPYTRCACAVALNGLGQSENGAAFLREALKIDPKQAMVGTLAYAAVALGEFWGDENLKVLCEVVNTSRYPVVVLNAINALGHRKDPRTVPFLIEKYFKLNGSVNEYIRGEIVRALLAHPPQETIRGTLLKALDDHSAYVRAKAAVALARYPGADVEKALLDKLNDRDEEVRGEASLTLGILKSARALPALRKLLDDEADWVRLRARRAVENIVRFGNNEFHQTAGIKELIAQRTWAVGASLAEEMNRLHGEGFQRVLELDRRER